MKRRNNSLILVLFCLAIGLFYVGLDMAEAARMGGGRSFGSRPSYQRTAPAPSQTPSGSTQMSPGSSTQQRPVGGMTSPTGRWGGMLGGMLMGGLIGSLLFGGGHAAGGGIGLFEILLIGGGLFLLMRFLRSKRMATQSAGAGNTLSFDGGSANAWGGEGYSPYGGNGPAAAPPPLYPPGFDAEDFLKGANQIYTRMQSSWDRRDLEDIRQFASAEVYDEIRRQAQEDPHPGKTEILMINPRIVEVREMDGRTVASVLYDVMLRENENEMPRQVRELWHFSRDAGNVKSFWVLEGIQQVE